MTKEAYYFSHDSNARNDPKIVAMLTKYQWFGYGLYWAIIEIMREQENYKLPSNKYTNKSLAMQLHLDEKQITDYLKDCIIEFELFEEKNDYIYSKSLLRRMRKKNDISKKRSQAAVKRWNKYSGLSGDNLDSKSDANALELQSNKSKRNKSKKKEKEIEKPENVTDQTWNDFLIHRKALKATVSKTVVNSFIKQSELAGYTLEQAMIESINRGWRGFKAEWIKDNISKTPLSEKISLEEFQEAIQYKKDNQKPGHPFKFKNPELNKIIEKHPMINDYSFDSIKFDMAYKEYLEL